MNIYYRLKETWYWLKCYLFHPYNVIRIKSLPPTWCDKSELIRESLFQLIVDFVDKEEPFLHIDWDSDDGHKSAQNCIIQSYKWVTKVRPELIEKSSKMLHEWGEKSNENAKEQGVSWFEHISTPETDEMIKVYHALEEKIEMTDDKILTNIIKYRGYLWT